MAKLTSLLTPVKIDGDPSGQTCEQMEGGGGGEGGGEQECNKASNKLARTPLCMQTHTIAHTLKV